MSSLLHRSPVSLSVVTVIKPPAPFRTFGSAREMYFIASFCSHAKSQRSRSPFFVVLVALVGGLTVRGGRPQMSETSLSAE